MPKGPQVYTEHVQARLTVEQFESLHAEQRPGEKMSETLRRIVQERADALSEFEQTGVPNLWSSASTKKEQTSK